HAHLLGGGHSEHESGSLGVGLRSADDLGVGVLHLGVALTADGGVPVQEIGHVVHEVAPRSGRLVGPSITSKSDRKSTRLNSSHVKTSYAVFCLKKKNFALPKRCTQQ